MTIETKPTGDYRAQLVLAAGAATTLVAFALVFALARSGTNIMGYYVNWILPMGAIFVGLVAASGYAVGAWFTGLRMTTRMAWSVVGQLLVSYFIAQYESYQLFVSSGANMGFWEWFDLSTRAFSFSSRNGSPGSPLEIWGYAFRLLEVVGFVGGGVIVPLALSSKAYCDTCRTYKRSSTIAMIPGGINLPNVDEGLYSDRGQASVVAIYQAAHAGDRAEVEKLIAERGPLKDKRVTGKLSAFTTMTLARCPRCSQGDLSSNVTRNQGGSNVSIEPLGGVALPSETIKQLFD